MPTTGASRSRSSRRKSRSPPASSSRCKPDMVIAPYYRDFDLPWEGDPESSARFRKILRVLLIVLVVLGIAFPLLPTPKRVTMEEVPQRLARVMLENKPKPPPPPPPVPKEEKPKIEPKIAVVKPPPVDERKRARDKAQKQLNQVKDELADLRDVMDLTPLETKNLSGSVGADAHAERSLITSKVGAGSGGITSADTSRGFGTGAGSLTGHDTTAVTSGIVRSGLNNRGPARSGGGGMAARSREEIELVFDRNKGRIYSLYARALRDNAELQGKLVLEFTIAPTGDVTMCRIVSSELRDPDLERKIIALVRLFRFDAKGVDADQVHDAAHLRFVNELYHRLTRVIEQLLAEEATRPADDVVLRMLLAPRADKVAERLVFNAYARAIQGFESYDTTVLMGS